MWKELAKVTGFRILVLKNEKYNVRITLRISMNMHIVHFYAVFYEAGTQYLRKSHNFGKPDASKLAPGG